MNCGHEGNRIFASAEYTNMFRFHSDQTPSAYNQGPHNRNMYLYFAAIFYDILTQKIIMYFLVIAHVL